MFHEEENIDIQLPDIEDMGEIRGDFEFLTDQLDHTDRIDQNLYLEYDVKRGLRDSAGKGVLTGLTEISDVVAFDLENGYKIPADGSLYYQGVNVRDIVDGMKGRRFGFEETSYLLRSVISPAIRRWRSSSE